MDIAQPRSELEKLEDTICMFLNQRLMFNYDKKIYKVGGIPIKGYNGSFFKYFFKETEILNSRLGRYTKATPEEQPFLIRPSKPIIQKNEEISEVQPVKNMTKKISSEYFTFLSSVCQEGENCDPGSTVSLDILCLQSLSRRVHLGGYIAEAKYQKDKELYDRLIAAEDIEGIRRQLRNIEKEEENLERIEKKSIIYGVPGELVCGFFKDTVMPTTIEVELVYFMSKGNKQ